MGEIAKAGGLYKWIQKQMKGRKITRADVEARAKDERERVYLIAWLVMFNLYDKSSDPDFANNNQTRVRSKHGKSSIRLRQPKDESGP